VIANGEPIAYTSGLICKAWPLRWIGERHCGRSAAEKKVGSGGFL